MAQFPGASSEYKMKVMNVQSQAPNPVISSICYDYNAYNRIVIAPKWTPFLSFIGKNSKASVLPDKVWH